MDKSESCGPGPKDAAVACPAGRVQNRGALMIPGVVPPSAWRVAGPDTRGLLPRRRSRRPQHLVFRRYAPKGGWPEFSPNLYELPSLQSIVEQIGGGVFSPSHLGWAAVTPQVPMTRVILPSVPGTEWAPPPTATSMGTRQAGAVGSWRSSPCCSGTSAAPPARHGLLAKVAPGEPPILSSSTPSNSTARTTSQSPCGAAGTWPFWRGSPNVGEVVCMTGRAGDAMLLHGLTTHIGSVNAAGSLQPRVAQFARYCHTEMREQAPLVMFPDKDGTPWSPPAPSPQVGNTRWCLTSKRRRQVFYRRATQAGSSSDTRCRRTSGNIGGLL